ncbi:MAG: 8-oxo-dGTP diphosphatase MutT [Acidobacteria bacterium]|nr:8-oxo-dGTP diphosphatase MutT [Acidobacteriota bacterium]
MGDGLSIAVAIIRKKNKFLITKRLNAAHLGGLWEFPGGKREKGESLEECLRREVREEVGIEIAIVKSLFRKVAFSYPDRQVELHFFLCRVRRGQAQPLQCQEVCWVGASELEAYEFAPANREVVKALKRKPKTRRPEI